MSPTFAEGRIMGFHLDPAGRLYVSVVDLADYLQEVARKARADGDEGAANLVASCAVQIIDGSGVLDGEEG